MFTLTRQCIRLQFYNNIDYECINMIIIPTKCIYPLANYHAYIYHIHRINTFILSYTTILTSIYRWIVVYKYCMSTFTIFEKNRFKDSIKD